MTTQTDQELLELAAYAAGVKNARWSNGFGGMAGNQDGRPVIFNPLTSDADAFRLMSRLAMRITYRSVDVDVSCFAACCSEYVPTYKDAAEATRRAITRAAAAIGQSMKEQGK
ncbi:hypothetical protein [Advenella mimigardefordensis]|uniref:hypothetical protein n=1 Tax=Advenella mimigardefordensis TaxID=302406 RepID=UPI00046C9DF0|nr:hypothetical protein [Advenella mimigardefordensis]